METYGPSRSNAQSNNPTLMGKLVLPAQQTVFVSVLWDFKMGHWKAAVIWAHSAQPPDLSVLLCLSATCLPTYSSTQACTLTFSTLSTDVMAVSFFNHNLLKITEHNYKGS